MKKVLVLVNTFDRWFTLGLSLEYLRRRGFKYDIVVHDGGSTNKEHLDFLAKVKDFEVVRSPYSAFSGNYSCGLTRKRCLDLALSRNQYDFYFMVDDDILFNNETIDQTLSDFDSVSQVCSVGSMSPHTFLPEGNSFVLGDTIYKQLLRGGEAHVLFPRETLVRCGVDKFGPFPKGFADLYFENQKLCGLDHVARFDPVSNIQHIGVGGGGVALKRQYTPKWVQRPYVIPGKSMFVPVLGFDVKKFSDVVSESGCKKACVDGISGEFFL